MVSESCLCCLIFQEIPCNPFIEFGSMISEATCSVLFARVFTLTWELANEFKISCEKLLNIIRSMENCPF